MMHKNWHGTTTCTSSETNLLLEVLAAVNQRHELQYWGEAASRSLLFEQNSE
jgi:hypothetical protein